MRSRPIRLVGVCLDCRDAEELASFYCSLLGWQERARDGRGWISVEDPATEVHLNIQAEDWYEPPTWPEQPGMQTKMLHFEIAVDDMAEAVDKAVAAGATVAAHQPTDRDPMGLRVMLDPAGHPFCLVAEGH